MIIVLIIIIIIIFLIIIVIIVIAFVIIFYNSASLMINDTMKDVKNEKEPQVRDKKNWPFLISYIGS